MGNDFSTNNICVKSCAPCAFMLRMKRSNFRKLLPALIGSLYDELCAVGVADRFKAFGLYGNDGGINGAAQMQSAKQIQVEQISCNHAVCEVQGKILILCNSKQEMQIVDVILWTYEQLRFIPHGTEDDPYIEQHPVLILTVHSIISKRPIRGQQVTIDEYIKDRIHTVVVLNYDFQHPTDDTLISTALQRLGNVERRIFAQLIC